MAKKSTQKKQATGRLKGASPISGVVPPPDKRWKKGQSGNPKGLKPGTTSLTAKLRRVLEANDGEVGQKIIDVAVKAAADGDWRFWNSIVERMEGKVADKVEGDGKLEIVVRHVKQGQTENDGDD